MLLGVLDIGSNSAQLQVFEARPGAPPLPTHAVKEPTLLGEAFGPDGAIDPAGVDRVVGAVNRAMDAARRLGVEQLYVFTTSAVRDAANRDLILDRVEAETGVRPQYLSGEDEARLIYLAVHQWYGWSAGRLLILDIGGDSMEIVLGRDAEPELAMSLPLGAGRLTRLFLPDDPPSRDQLAALRRHVNATLREVADRLLWEGVPERAVGTSKTFKQLARLSGAPARRKGEAEGGITFPQPANRRRGDSRQGRHEGPECRLRRHMPVGAARRDHPALSADVQPVVRSPVAPAQRLDLRPGRAGRQARHAGDQIFRLGLTGQVSTP
jgi:exopolyphosphatase / guanosine-5'-triphosphate,3'-diphosphate pyrophosphatase